MEGEIVVDFENGRAEFTRLRVDRPATNLDLHFTTSPGGFTAQTTVSFTVIEPPANTPRKDLVFKLAGDISVLSSLDKADVINNMTMLLAKQLDIDVSRLVVNYYIEVRLNL